ncbi:hypothetical protein PRZ48_012701 [Zasmidium cellare]|uniref:Zn(2)-C6 fungal-type domain-containing protein n=1 Tax=Zasmidium cellare TaxID=395010 RepID=A0ABR0E615_ZASCE|nr:hypothetical protein PRZ48_012701 [Zasmidium cellare]
MLVSHRPSPPGQLDTRADSPMREKAHLLGNSSVNRNTAHGLPTPATDIPSYGWAAVNGEGAPRHPPPPQDKPTHVVYPPGWTSDPGQATAPAHNLQSWRPEASHTSTPVEAAAPRDSPSNKRKRDDSNGNDDVEDGRDGASSAIGDRSPKRPMTVLNSGGIHSPEQSNQTRSYSPQQQDGLEQPSTGTYVREPTPTGRTGRMSPPPQARPETVSGLAASLNATLREEQQAQAAARSSSPPNDADQSIHFMSTLGNADDNDPKRRKRNFSNRTKTGCHTCRTRKKKCDEGKPRCNNCEKGGFQCGGYGPKPPGGTNKIGAVRPVPLQAKQYEQAPGPPPFYEPPHPSHNPALPPPPHNWSDPHRPEPYGSVPYRYGNHPPADYRPPSARDGWGPRPSWGPHEHSQAYPPERLPPADFPPPHYPHDRPPQPGPPAPWGGPHSQPPCHRPTLPPPPNVAPTVISSHESIATSHSGSHARLSLGYSLTGPLNDRKKMLVGMPYRHYMDDELIADRQSCRRAVQRYNEICEPSSTAPEDEKGRQFNAVLNPRARPPNSKSIGPWMGPTGVIGDCVMIQTPFKCEFGYNINIGDRVLIESGCFMQDAATIFIGDGTVVGPDVKFLCLTTSVDASLRDQGCQGYFNAGAIRVEEGCYIGANVTILPFRTIGRGATVGAGSVVTRDVKPGTVVAGNPAKPIRGRKIETGAPDADRHVDAIQEENEQMLELMKADAIVPREKREKMLDKMEDKTRRLP